MSYISFQNPYIDGVFRLVTHCDGLVKKILLRQISHSKCDGVSHKDYLCRSVTHCDGVSHKDFTYADLSLTATGLGIKTLLMQISHSLRRG